MIVIYAEKPDVGMKIAAALDCIHLDSGTVVSFDNLDRYEKEVKAQRTRDGMFRILYDNEETIVTWGIGHMVGLKQAYDYVEKLYTSGVNTEEETIICNLIADMVKEKMQNVNCMVMGCSDYRTAFNSQGIKKVFISHTKNREQYMDSFGGENNASNEAKYVRCTAYYDEE